MDFKFLFQLFYIILSQIWKPSSELAVAQVEVHKIADYLHADPWLGSQVTKQAILTQLPRATVIHLALYGSWEEGVLVCTPNPTTQPNESGVYPEGAYQIGIQDVVGMRLCSQLVVLSCCYGNRHRQVHLDLPLAFIAAGMFKPFLSSTNLVNSQCVRE